MRRFTLFPLSIFITASLGLSACNTVGNKELDDMNTFISLKPSVDSKETIYAKLGQPADVTYKDSVTGPSVWTYVKSEQHTSGWSYVPYVGVLAGGQGQENTKALFEFDKAGRYVTVHTNKDTHYINSWVGLGELAAGRSRPQVQRVHDEMDRLGKPFDLKRARILGEVRYITVPRIEPAPR